MGLLKRVPAILGGALAVAALGCLMSGRFGFGAATPGFPHAAHGEEAGLDCTACHAGAESGDEPGMPKLSQCQLCHKDLDEGKPPEQQATAFFLENALQAQRLAALTDEVRFSHQAHVASYGIACADCHGDLAANPRVTADVRVTMAKCVDCHAARKAPNECATCHQEIRIDRPPADHVASWKREHGGALRMGGREESGSCAICHQQSACDACHRTELPQDHGGYWRRRGHGVAVAVDRNRCATCHQSDSCDRCHQESSPVSHTASWGSPRDRHCVTCHLPLGGDQGCATCHQAAPSHALAAPLPANHAPGMNCRQCHGLTAPLPHPDKGDQCTACHR